LLKSLPEPIGWKEAEYDMCNELKKLGLWDGQDSQQSGQIHQLIGFKELRTMFHEEDGEIYFNIWAQTMEGALPPVCL